MQWLSMSPEEKVRLTHIVEAATLIASYINGVSKDAFLRNPMRQEDVLQLCSRAGGRGR